MPGARHTALRIISQRISHHQSALRHPQPDRAIISQRISQRAVGLVIQIPRTLTGVYKEASAPLASSLRSHLCTIRLLSSQSISLFSLSHILLHVATQQRVSRVLKGVPKYRPWLAGANPTPAMAAPLYASHLNLALETT